MLFTQDPKVDYDNEFDVMNYRIGDTSNSYGDEDVDNIVTFRDMNTDEITGYTIMNFKRICRTRSKEYEIISKIMDVPKVLSMC